MIPVLPASFVHCTVDAKLSRSLIRRNLCKTISAFDGALVTQCPASGTQSQLFYGLLTISPYLGRLGAVQKKAFLALTMVRSSRGLGSPKWSCGYVIGPCSSSVVRKFGRNLCPGRQGYISTGQLRVAPRAATPAKDIYLRNLCNACSPSFPTGCGARLWNQLPLISRVMGVTEWLRVFQSVRPRTH